MEEDIKVLKNLIYMLNDETHKLHTTIEYIQAIENLIKEYKELEALKYDFEAGFYMPRCDVEEYYVPIERLNDYIEKSELREKMKQDTYTNEHTILGGRRNGKTLEYGIRLGRIQMCEELLQEENNNIYDFDTEELPPSNFGKDGDIWIQRFN